MSGSLFSSENSGVSLSLWSISPDVKRVAAAEPFGRDAGATLNRVSKADVESMFPDECGVEGLIELIACEEVVIDNASMISCFSFACKDTFNTRVSLKVSVLLRTQGLTTMPHFLKVVEQDHVGRK